MPILILGGGIAGLAAAKTLVDQGHEVVIIEARSRLGGRIDTAKLVDGKTTFERGANWVEATGKNPVLELWGKQLKTFTTQLAKVVLYENGEELEPEPELFEIEEQLYSFISKKYQNPNQLKNKSVDQILDEFCAANPVFGAHHAMLKNILRLILNTDNALEIEKLGAAQFHARCPRAGQPVPGLKPVEEAPLLVMNGYNQIVEDLKKQLENSGRVTFYLQHPISNVAFSDNTATVTCLNQGKQILIEGQGVVCALPVSVMQQLTKTKSITPELPASIQEGIDAIEMGVMNKVVLQFAKQFWDSAHFIGWCENNNAVTAVNYNAANPGSNILVVYYTGERAKFTGSDQEVIHQTLDELQIIYGERVVKTSLLNAEVTRWHEDPYAQGAYSVMPVNATVTARSDAAAPLTDRQMVFAGEHVAYYPGTVHGAFISGQQAAHQLMAMLSPEKHSEPKGPGSSV